MYEHNKGTGTNITVMVMAASATGGTSGPVQRATEQAVPYQLSTCTVVTVESLGGLPPPLTAPAPQAPPLSSHLGQEGRTVQGEPTAVAIRPWRSSCEPSDSELLGGLINQLGTPKYSGMLKQAFCARRIGCIFSISSLPTRASVVSASITLQGGSLGLGWAGGWEGREGRGVWKDYMVQVQSEIWVMERQGQGMGFSGEAGAGDGIFRWEWEVWGVRTDWGKLHKSIEGTYTLIDTQQTFVVTRAFMDTQQRQVDNLHLTGRLLSSYKIFTSFQGIAKLQARMSGSWHKHCVSNLAYIISYLSRT